MTATVKGLTHLLNRALVTVKGRNRSALSNVVDVAGQVALQGDYGLDDIGGANQPAQTPTSHGVGLSHAVKYHGGVSQLRHSLNDGGELGVVVNQVLIDFIGKYPNPVLKAPTTNSLSLFRGVNRAGGVRGRAEHQRLGGRGVGLLQLGRGDLVVGVGVGKNAYRNTASQSDGLRVGGPIGGGQQNLIALTDNGCETLIHCLLATVGDHNVGRVDGVATVTQSLSGNSLL